MLKPNQTTTDLFAQADLLLFKDKKYYDAEALYAQILQIEKSAAEAERNERNCIDALNSMGYCIKFRTSLQDMLSDKEIEDGQRQPSVIQLGGPSPQAIGVFSQLVKIYQQALSYDTDDVEANFNLAGLYLQRN